MKEETRRTFEIHFRTATYHSFTEVVTGLRTVMGHLVQVCMNNITCHDGNLYRTFYVTKTKSGMLH